jgi:hypothetical protein
VSVKFCKVILADVDAGAPAADPEDWTARVM